MYWGRSSSYWTASAESVARENHNPKWVCRNIPKREGGKRKETEAEMDRTWGWASVFSRSARNIQISETSSLEYYADLLIQNKFYRCMRTNKLNSSFFGKVIFADSIESEQVLHSSKHIVSMNNINFFIINAFILRLWTLPHPPCRLLFRVTRIIQFAIQVLRF